MKMINTALTDNLRNTAEQIADVAKAAGLDFFPTIFEMIDYNQINEIAAYGGFPTRYPHWRFGMEYERLSKSYEYGLATIYEMVINTNPCYAYLMRSNNLVDQKTVIAHVYAHCDFFKNNYWFSRTNRKMLDQMANHASFVRSAINQIGHDQVEAFIDACLSIENLIDIHSPFKEKPKVKKDASDQSSSVQKLQSKKYMDSYINPAEFIQAQEKARKEAAPAPMSFPARPERDVLLFLLKHAPLNDWERRILEIVRDESYYFAPQGQTKIMNEGWATYWHSLIMTKLYPLSDAEIVDYCDRYSSIVAMSSGGLNPYKLGVELMRHIENRWNKGQFGLDYLHCDDPKVRAEWDKKTNLGRQKIFEVRKFHNDVTFLDEFLDEDFCHHAKLFIYDYDPRSNKHVISSRNFKEIKTRLLQQLTNFGQPMIDVVDGNYRNRNELLLKHCHEGTDLKHDFTLETLRNLYKLWRRPVHLETIIEDVKRRVSYDGNNHQIEKI